MHKSFILLFSVVLLNPVMESLCQQITFYPNQTGNFWEYILYDSTTIKEQFYSAKKFSLTKEVTFDTTLNGFTYKCIKWKNESNSANNTPRLEYHRVDTAGNVFISYNNNDYILFDFSKQTSETYPSHLTDHQWKVMNRYPFVVDQDTLQAIDFALYEQGITTIKEKYTVLQNYGIVFFWNSNQYAEEDSYMWGAIINNVKYGELLAIKEIVNWKEFYPLHIGDYWVYEGVYGSIPVNTTVMVMGDSLMPDGNRYFIKKTIDHAFGYINFSFSRIDNNGTVYFWDPLQNRSKAVMKFGQIVGDTSSIQFTNAVNRIEDKAYYYLEDLNSTRLCLKIMMYPEFVFNEQIYARGLGLYEHTLEGTYSRLKGAYINSVLYGDTNVTEIKDVINIPKDYPVLYPSYPNPFNSSTTISFYLPEAAYAGLSVYNMLGERVAEIISKFFNAGLNKISYDAAGLSSGSYIIVLKSNKCNMATKVLYLK